MIHLDDLPKRGPNCPIQAQSEAMFRNAISSCKEFVIQSKLQHDYGTDFLIEACEAGRMTNTRISVQLKGSDQEENEDGSVSVSVKRTNLNYQLVPPDSLYVCYHIPTKRLLVKQADDVFRVNEYKSDRWREQSTITVRFSEEFDEEYQRRHKEIVVASAKGRRDQRLQFTACPPEKMCSLLSEETFDIPIPSNQQQAEELLLQFYKKGKCKTISRSFGKFRAILGSSNSVFIHTYMAEIDLGMNGKGSDRDRILEGIEVMERAISDGMFTPGSMLYCIANGWFAINEYERAEEAYHLALDTLIAAGPSEVVAQCCKNLGSTMEKLNKPDKACHFYKRALEFDAELAEAHFALALWNRRSGNFETAVSHLDKIVWSQGSAGTREIVSGWRAEILFELCKIEEAIRQINSLLSVADRYDWVWPWCAKLVATYGRVSLDAAKFSVQFWNRYLKQDAGDTGAKKQRLLCVWYLYSNSHEAQWDYHEFKRNVVDVVNDGIPNPEFLWYRVGLWAQKEENWTEAEEWYRKAYEHCSEEYGYYLGTVLNHINRYEEALQILLRQAKEHYPDELSWFQVAIAMEGVGDTKGCIDAYERVLKLDETYAKAWFNLGGIYCNSGQIVKAKKVWTEAIRRFPEHELAARLKTDLPGIFGP